MNKQVVFAEVEKMLSVKMGSKTEIIASVNIGGGCINNAAKLVTNNGNFFLKWNANVAADAFLREAECLTEMKKAASVEIIIPTVYAAKLVDSTPGFLVQEYLTPGRSSINQDEELGRGLAHIHKYSAKKFGFFTNNYCGATPQKNTWCESWLHFFANYRLLFLLGLIKKHRGIGAAEITIFEKFIEKLPQLIPTNCTPVLIHGDLWSGNYMHTQNGVALIDPASYYAHFEMEFGIITMFGGFSDTFFSAYNEVNPLPPDWRQRNPIYQMYHVLNHYYLFGGAYLNQAIRIAKSFL